MAYYPDFVAGHFRMHWSLPLSSPSALPGNQNANTSFLGGEFSDLGDTTEGFTEETTLHHQPIIGDRGGLSQMSGVQLGGDLILTFEAIHYGLMERVFLRQWGASNSKLLSPYTNVGHILTDIASPLVLTPVRGTPADLELQSQFGSAVPCSKIYYCAIIQTNIPKLLSAHHRKGRCSFRCYPSPNSSPTGQQTFNPQGQASGWTNGSDLIGAILPTASIDGMPNI